MADLKYYDIIFKPVITEKSTDELEKRKYAFYVHPDATKIQVKEAVEKMFAGVKVKKVNTMNLAGKMRRRGYFKGRKAARKKAIIMLTKDSRDIEIYTGM